MDNQLPLTPMPVLFRSQRIGEEVDYILKFSLTQQSNGSLDFHIYPHIGFQVCNICFSSSVLFHLLDFGLRTLNSLADRDLKILPS